MRLRRLSLFWIGLLLILVREGSLYVLSYRFSLPYIDRVDESDYYIAPFQVALPTDLASGDYRVMVGLYNYVDGARLPISDADGKSLGDSLELMRLKVGS